MAGGGAVVAIVAAAHAQRLQEITDAFRLAGATAPERARTLEALGVMHREEVAELARAGVLVAGPGRDSWYLSESAVVARRAAGNRRTRRAIGLALLLTLAMAIALLIMLRAAPALS